MMPRGPDGDRIELARQARAAAPPPRDTRSWPPQAVAWIADCPGVRFVDSKAIWWCVSEQPCSEMDPQKMQCLVFMSEAVIRRVLNFPPDWRSLAPDQLEALSWRR
jgi:hypothetical protein